MSRARFVVVGPAAALPVPLAKGQSIRARGLVQLALTAQLTGRPGWAEPMVTRAERQGGAWLVEIESKTERDRYFSANVQAASAERAAARLTALGRGTVSVTMSRTLQEDRDETREHYAFFGTYTPPLIGTTLAVSVAWASAHGPVTRWSSWTATTGG